jgi:hypothetical protein
MERQVSVALTDLRDGTIDFAKEGSGEYGDGGTTGNPHEQTCAEC